MERKKDIKTFQDLSTWKEGHELVLGIYKITEEFPKHEAFGLTGQMRRAAVSITSNIAEGFKRRSSKDKMRFYSISQGSLSELQNQMIISRDIGYIKEADFDRIYSNSITIDKLLSGLIKYCRSNP